MKYFVFIKGLRGPEGQLLSELPVTGEGKDKQTYLFGPHKLKDGDENRNLDYLILKFKDKINVATD